MCSKWVTGEFNDALKAASEFSKAARENNFTPIREKIEQPLSYAPDDFVPSKSKGEYWEFHYKLHLANREEGENLHSKILNADQWKKNARMSKSALREKANDGGIYRIVTLRLYDGDKAHAKGKCDELKAWLTSNECNVIKIQREISVYDDYLELDQGWL
uniref:uncharacterized protein LOC120348324 n=1 Tax=Styela clava TaxID=7725 RepID=UPI001939B362|nr:uncharacterized protein LOC120348324 [Styela clava]